MDRARWPLALAAAALLLGASASIAASGGGDWLAGGLQSLGAACVGAWIRDHTTAPPPDERSNP